MRINKQSLKALTRPEKGAKLYFDDQLKGFGARVTKSRVSFFYQGRIRGQKDSVRVPIAPDTVKTPEEARKIAKDLAGTMVRGVDPRIKVEANPKSKTLQGVFDIYLGDTDLKPLTIKDYTQKLKWGFSDWLGKPVDRITKDMIKERHAVLSKKSKRGTNNAFRVLRAVLNHPDLGVEVNPVDVLKRQGKSKRKSGWHSESPREEKIMDHQLEEWLAAVETLEPPIHRVAFKMLLFLGFRVSECYTAQWRDVDLNGKIITLRDTKNGFDHSLPIPKVLMPEIEQLRDITGKGKYLFPAEKRDGSHGRPVRQIKQVNEQLSFHWTPHLCRHTFASIATFGVKLPEPIVKRLLNHREIKSATDGYQHADSPELIGDIEKISSYIRSAAGGKGDVVELRNYR